MKRRRLPIDWDELETALTWRFEEGGHYLDLETGEIIAWTGRDDDVTSEDDIDGGLADGRLLEITPLESSVEYGWMSEFAESVSDPVLAQLIEVALHGKGAFRRFKDVLAGNPAERQRWDRSNQPAAAQARSDVMRAPGRERILLDPRSPEHHLG